MLYNKKDFKQIVKLNPMVDLKNIEELNEVYKPYLEKNITRTFMSWLEDEKIRVSYIQMLANILFISDDEDRYEKYIKQFLEKPLIQKTKDLFFLYCAKYDCAVSDTLDEDQLKLCALYLEDLLHNLVGNGFEAFECNKIITAGIKNSIEEYTIKLAEDVENFEKNQASIFTLCMFYFTFSGELEDVLNQQWEEDANEDEIKLIYQMFYETLDMFSNQLSSYLVGKGYDEFFSVLLDLKNDETFSDLLQTVKSNCENLKNLQVIYPFYKRLAIKNDIVLNETQEEKFEELYSQYSSLYMFLKRVDDSYQKAIEQKLTITSENIKDWVEKEGLNDFSIYPYYEDYCMSGKATLIPAVDYNRNEVDDEGAEYSKIEQ